MADPEKNAWVQRVLGVSIPAADGESARGVVQSRKLLLRWRQAQQDLSVSLQTLASSVLAHPEVRADPRIDAVEAALRDLPDLVPTFGGRLEDLLDAGINAGGVSGALAADALGAISEYRSRLQAVPQLAALERFGAANVGVNVQLASALESVMSEMESELRQAA